MRDIGARPGGEAVPVRVRPDRLLTDTLTCAIENEGIWATGGVGIAVDAMRHVKNGHSEEWPLS
jgi:hypothetical protein